MWFYLGALLITLFITIEGVDIPDVTTVYEVKYLNEHRIPPHHGKIHSFAESQYNNITGVVYKRTNVLGLNLFLGATKYESKTYNPELSCDINSACDWEFTGWSRTYSSSRIGKKINPGETYSVLEGFSLNFNRKYPIENKNQDIFIVFPQENSTLSIQEPFYVLKMFESGSLMTRFYYMCDTRHYRNHIMQIPVSGEDSVVVRCDTYFDSGWLIDPDSSFVFKYDGNLKMYLNGSSTALMDFPYQNYAMTFVSFYWEKLNNLEPFISTSQSWKSTENGSTIVSPAFVPTSKIICLAVVIYCPSETKHNVLQVSVLDHNHVEHVEYMINSLKAGWQVRHISIEAYNKIASPWKLVFRKIDAIEIQISRISSCSTNGAEIEVLSPLFRKKDQKFGEIKKDLPVYTAASEVIPEVKKLKNVSNSCLNGGVLTISGCACAPGFMGSQCQIGCGRNRFGQDCGGRCSLRSRECEGFLLCTELTGCKCAPGYTGVNCLSKCPDGQYGNDCEQECGRCKGGEPCNKYSGKCEGCAFGYLPPYCKQEYVYYSQTPTLVSEKYETITVSFNVQKGIAGFGEPKMYQIQYKVKDESEDWRTYVSKLIGSSDLQGSDTSGQEGLIKETIEGLKDGTWYEVRVLLMDSGFNKYDGDKVRSSQVLTKCDVPDEFDYKLQSSSNQTIFTFSWAYELPNKHWCPVEKYEVSWKENHRILTDHTFESAYLLTDFLPGSAIDFKVRAVTTGGYAPYSKSPSISTNNFGNGPVDDLRMTSSKSTVLDIAWSPPFGSENRQLKYKITYECVNQVACSPGCENALEGQLTQEATSVTLSALLPFTQYKVTVTPEDGPESQLYVGTSEVAPTEVPVLSSQSPVRSNTSVTVYWDAVPVCSSFLQGYTYQLTKESESLKMLSSGFTKETSVSFYNLTASTDYIVKVFINTVAGWNPAAFLAINISTSATVPEAVRNLTVYKKGRSMLGLRWAEPRTLYGKLKSFTVQHSLGKEVTSVTVEPTPCTVWPELYCYTIENLKSNRKYTVKVSARNVDMAEDGAVASTVAVTKESAPLPPDSLKVLNNTSTSVGLQWKHPSLVNGILRSFLVNVEESEKFDQDSCCQVYPLIEILVKEETQFYEVEVSGLHPASTYYVSVSAKTVSMGLSQALLVFTRPPHLPLNTLPPREAYEQEFPMEGKDTQWLPQQQSLQVNNSDVFSPLVTAHILLAAVNGTAFSHWREESGIKDKQLDSLLRESIFIPFYFKSEYNQDGLVADSAWGKVPDHPFLGVNQLVAVQISDYNGVYNIDVLYSSIF